MSFHRPFETTLPVVVTQVQNFDERTKLITTRQHLSPRPFEDSNFSAPHFSMFVQVNGEGIWCVASVFLDAR